MDKEVISAKLESLRRCVRRIEDKTPETAEALLKDNDLQDIICINLERAVQISVDLASHIIAESNIPAAGSMGESFEKLSRLDLISAELASRMKKAVGFRNIAVHAYQEINWKIVYAIITSRLTNFVEYAKAVTHAADLP
ncbi:MAG: DUF86 domain-containing protein [Acidobacteria bacterium]|nr:DUF86 domain-containing protein [Acidobacteriota bacterium]